MSYKLSDVMYETANHFLIKVKGGYEGYRNGITHATRCAIIGWEGERGLVRGKAELDRREVAILEGSK